MKTKYLTPSLFTRRILSLSIYAVLTFSFHHAQSRAASRRLTLISSAEKAGVISDVVAGYDAASYRATIKVNCSRSAEISFALISLTGRIEKEGTWLINAGENFKTLEMNDLHSGLFMIQVRIGRETFTKKIIKP